MHKPLLCVALLFTAACGPDLESELATRVAEADVIFHIGSAERSGFSAELCEDERRVCGDVLDDAALALADGPIVVELLVNDVESESLLTWFIAPDGSGELYAYRGTDFPLECFWEACGLTKTCFAAGGLIDDDGAPVLRRADVGDVCE